MPDEPLYYRGQRRFAIRSTVQRMLLSPARIVGQNFLQGPKAFHFSKIHGRREANVILRDALPRITHGLREANAM